MPDSPDPVPPRSAPPCGCDGVAQLQQERDALAKQLERRADGMDPLTQHLRARVDELERQRLLLAKLAATAPQFFNPLQAMEAALIRDAILRGDHV